MGVDYFLRVPWIEVGYLKQKIKLVVPESCPLELN